MKDLKAFMEKASKDGALAQRVSNAITAGEVVKIAADDGYQFSENDLMQVAGGLFGSNGGLNVGDIGIGDLNTNVKASLVDVVNKEININTSGSGNTVQNTGSIS